MGVSRKLFIDCGGHDGCSAIKFLDAHPEFECITFEPNSALRKYYRLIPTRLVESAISTYDGTVPLLVDTVDGDGSTILPIKKVDATGTFENSQCPQVSVPCVDLDAFIRNNTSGTDYVVLKLDIEGAEYAVLEKLLKDGTISRVSELFVEFHWDRAGIPEERHDALIHELRYKYDCIPQHWDAVAYAVHRLGVRALLKRYALIVSIRYRRFLLHLSRRRVSPA